MRLMLDRRTHKYGAVATTVDGIRFASKAEARRYQELKLLEKAGEICHLELQPVFTLNAPMTSVLGRLKEGAARLSGKPLILPTLGRYVGDFRYREVDTLKEVVEDVKGFKTPLYRWKRKHMMAQYGIEIREVTSR